MIAAFLVILNMFAGNSGFESDLQKYLVRTFSSYEKIEFQIEEKLNLNSKIIIDDEREARLNKNLLYVPVKLISRNKSESNSFISVRIKLFRKVWVSNQEIQKDEMLSTFQFRKELKDVALLNGTVFSDEELPVASRSKVKIREGMVLLNEMFEKNPDVLPNDRLILHAGRNGVDITTEVTSREKGSVGDIIRVLSDQKKIFTAKIIDKYNVLLIE
ncbi:MAG: flagellar basal body P-ring formation protein FlgA [Ignavibacteria bacterium]|nr:flagellar basal body P-ring formation protein FlgA [Ignavibacteria bacterium]